MSEYIISKEEAFALEVLYKNSGEELRDFEQIVRCKDCRHFRYCRFFRTKKNKPQGFCAWGEERGKWASTATS